MNPYSPWRSVIVLVPLVLCYAVTVIGVHANVAALGLLRWAVRR